MSKNIKAIWDNYAKVDLKDIYNFSKNAFSTDFAKKITREILQSISDIIYTEQWSYDDIISKPYRRIIIRHYKIVYIEKDNNCIYILRIFDCRQNPNKLSI